MSSSYFPNGFLDLDPQYADVDQARFVVLPVAYDGTASYRKGACDGPGAIIEASQQVELFDEELLAEFHHTGIHTHRTLDGRDLSPAEMHQRILAAAKPLLARDKFILALGGEHAITPPLIAAAQQKFPNLSVLQFDAHADLRDTYQGTPFSHACVMRRIHDLNVPFASVGIRSYCRDQHAFIRDHNISIVTPQQVASDPRAAADTIIEQLTEEVYITFDIDALDPAIAPATGTPEPGGLTYQDVLTLIRALAHEKTLIAADITEVKPIPGHRATEVLAARLAYKIIAYTQQHE